MTVYTLTSTNNLIKNSDGSLFPVRPGNGDFRMFIANAPPGVVIANPDGSYTVVPDGTYVSNMDNDIKMSQHRTIAIQDINLQVSTTRQKYTTHLINQESVYSAKALDATNYLADDNPDVANYPYVLIELNILATTDNTATAASAAQAIIAARDEWETKNILIEEYRSTATRRIKIETDYSSIQATVNEFTKKLRAV